MAYKMKANQKWKHILEHVLSKNPDKMRGFLKTVNPGMYVKIKQLGQQYYLKEFKPPTEKVIFPDIENNKVELEGNADETVIESKHLNEGVKLLKKTVRDKLLDREVKWRSTKSESLPKAKTQDIITPLVLLMRGNQEIK